MESHDDTPISMTETSTAESPNKSDQPEPPEEPIHPLMAEVECFLSKRDELARKLAVEIEVTEKKLAELKKTASSLFPENVGGGSTDRKSKKHKTKASSREAKAESVSSNESPRSTDVTS